MNRIKDLRLEFGWTQERLGKELSVKGAAVSKYENGLIPLTDDTIKRLSEIFSASADYILGLSDIRTPASKPHPRDTIADEIEVLSDDSKKELEQYIKYLKIKENMDKSKDETSSTSEKHA